MGERVKITIKEIMCRWLTTRSSSQAVQFAAMQWCAEKHGWTKFVSMQSMYNLLYREEER